MLRGVAELFDKGSTGVPLPLVNDGDLVATIRTVLGYKGLSSVKVSKVWDMLRQNDGVINARRALVQGNRHWFLPWLRFLGLQSTMAVPLLIL